jgi:hypothetical protein
VVVTDAGNNRIPNVPVTFAALTGGGSLNGAPSQVVTTDSDGRALAVFTLGPAAAGGSNVVQADFVGNTGGAVAFTAFSKLAGDPSKTTISGVVLDNSNSPIPNVTMRLYQTNQGSNNNLPLQIGTPVVTDAQGHFLIVNAPFGYFKLMADGLTAGGGTTSYPTLEYDIVTIAGLDNTVGTPIYLPVLNTANQLCVDATHGGTLTLPQSPGFSLTIAPGAATFPGGARQGCVSVSTVNGDKVPMSPGFGQQPRFIVTIQPVGTIFNPPAAMTLPNVDGLAPREKTEMYSYDHDLSMFIAIGTATVSDDGSVIASDPGTGVLKAGWHCGGDPNAVGHVADCKACKICNGVECVADPNATACNQPDSFTYQGVEVNFDATCQGACQQAGGSCAPNAGGFTMSLMQDAVQKALARVFDNNPQTACIDSTFRNVLQQLLQQEGMWIQCSDVTSKNECGESLNQTGADGFLTRTNEIEVNTAAVAGKVCPSGPDGLASVILHEMIHAYGLDPGAPNEKWHNGVDGGFTGQFTQIIDCRDRVYGCQESCFPGSTADKNLGNKQACALPQGQVFCQGTGNAFSCGAPGCGLCDVLPTGDVICNTKPN